MILNNFGQFVRTGRESINLLQKELSDGICTRSMISRIETEDYFPHITIVEKLLDRLMVPIPVFLEELCREDKEQKALGIIIEFLNEKYEKERDFQTIQKWIQNMQEIRFEMITIFRAHMHSLRAFVEDVKQNFEEAEKEYKKFIELARGLNDVSMLASGLNRLAFMYVNIDLDKASEFIEEAYSLATLHSIPTELTISINLTLSAYKYGIGEYHTAIQILQAVKNRKRLSPVFRFRSHNLLGRCFHAIGKYTEAEQEYKQTQNYFKYSTSGELIFNNNIGNLYADMGKYDLAFKHQNRSIEIALETNQPYFGEICRLRLAKLHNLTGRNGEAELICKEIIEESWNPRNISIAKLILSESRFELNNEDCTEMICDVINFFNEQGGRDDVQYQKEAYKLLAKVKMPKDHVNLFPAQLLIY
ncbi:helix-turn-helix transcriptional regulator [Paenibacillus alkalitolerans]|uniref:helix-turn-helix transcriptional regulator n=1 Tax=Paenibacillus alkalitolerans TaxID=2799335 RepID=UPI0018F47823|nr:helix-turn-helix transcriptional regulator [Paenibacillus alkalitolerans]